MSNLRGHAAGGGVGATGSTGAKSDPGSHERAGLPKRGQPRLRRIQMRKASSHRRGVAPMGALSGGEAFFGSTFSRDEAKPLTAPDASLRSARRRFYGLGISIATGLAVAIMLVVSLPQPARPQQHAASQTSAAPHRLKSAMQLILKHTTMLQSFAVSTQSERSTWPIPSGMDDMQTCATLEPIEPNRKVIWSFWDSDQLRDVPDDVAAIVHSWKLWAPDYQVRLLSPSSAKCYLPEVNLNAAKELKLRTDIMRLRLLHKYGGVWMDSTVLLTRPLDIGDSGFVAVGIPEYNTISLHPADFVESWFLAADPGDYLVGMWAETLERVVSENHGVTAGISSTSIFTERSMRPAKLIEQHLPHGDTPNANGERLWAEYLVVYTAFTHLSQTDPQFRASLDNATILDATEAGYMLQLKYDWNRERTRGVLGAKFMTHPDHAQLVRGGIIKLSTSDREPIIQHFLSQRSPAPDEPPSFFHHALRLVSNANNLRRDQFQLVVAQYDEDLSWTDEGYMGTRRVYTKGTPTPTGLPSPFDTYTLLPNRGHECDTYLKHVIDNYDSLSKYISFTQGVLSSEHSWIRSDWGPQMFATMRDEAIRNNGCSSPMRVDPPAGPDWSFDFNITRLLMGSDGPKYQMGLTARPSSRNFGEWFHHFAGLREDPSGIMYMFPSGVFTVSRDRVRSRPRSYYEQLRTQLDAPSPVECHYLERAWYYVFNCDR